MSGNMLCRKINSQLKITFKKALHPVGRDSELGQLLRAGREGDRLSAWREGQLKGSSIDIKLFFFPIWYVLRKANSVKCMSLYEIVKRVHFKIVVSVLKK